MEVRLKCTKQEFGMEEKWNSVQSEDSVWKKLDG
jgi:hypothetical protein